MKKKCKKMPKKLHIIETFCNFAPEIEKMAYMKREIFVYKNYFYDFLSTLSEKVVEKIDYGLSLLESQDRISRKFVKYLRDDVYELRTEYESNIYRVFFIFDKGNIVVLFNGFQKKSQKTPQSELNKAIKLKEEYYASKS